MTNKQIKALIPTLSERPEVYYDLVRRLVAEGFTFAHDSAEWCKNKVRGRICFTQTEAWLRHPSNKTTRKEK